MATPVLGSLYGPLAYYLGLGAGTSFTFQFNQITDQLYYTFVALQSDTVDDYEFTVSIGGARTLEVMISEIDGNGRPTGVVAGGGASETVDCTAAGRKTGSFGTPSTLVAGTQYALLLQHDSGAGNPTIRTGWGITSGDANRWGAYVAQVNGGVYGETLQSLPRLGAYYSDGVGVGNIIQEQAILAAITNASTPNEYACAFSVPVSMTINGMSLLAAFLAAGATGTMTLYDQDGTSVLYTQAFNGNWSTARDWWFIPFSSDVTLTPGGTYRIGFKATNANLCTIWTVDFDDAGQKEAWLNPAQEDFSGSTRKDAGAWAANTLQMILAGVHIKELNLVAAPACSAPSVSYGAWTRTGPVNTPWTLNFLASDGANPVAAFELWTAASRAGTQVASGVASSASPNSSEIAYDAAGLADGDQTLYLSVDDGLGNIGEDCTFTLRRDDVDPTASTAVSVSEA